MAPTNADLIDGLGGKDGQRRLSEFILSPLLKSLKESTRER